MMKRIIGAVAAVLAAAAFYVVYDMGVWMGEWEPLLHPSGVPSTAHFYSTIEEKQGLWFDCSVDVKRQVNPCRVWEENGRLLVNGDFRIEDGNRMATASELKPTRALWSHGKVYMICLAGLRGACDQMMVPVKENQK